MSPNVFFFHTAVKVYAIIIHRANPISLHDTWNIYVKCYISHVRSQNKKNAYI